MTKITMTSGYAIYVRDTVPEIEQRWRSWSDAERGDPDHVFIVLAAADGAAVFVRPQHISVIEQVRSDGDVGDKPIGVGGG